jgi:hypothetical protein
MSKSKNHSSASQENASEVKIDLRNQDFVDSSLQVLQKVFGVDIRGLNEADIVSRVAKNIVDTIGNTRSQLQKSGLEQILSQAVTNAIEQTKDKKSLGSAEIPKLSAIARAVYDAIPQGLMGDYLNEKLKGQNAVVSEIARKLLGDASNESRAAVSLNLLTEDPSLAAAIHNVGQLSASDLQHRILSEFFKKKGHTNPGEAEYLAQVLLTKDFLERQIFDALQYQYHQSSRTNSSTATPSASSANTHSPIDGESSEDDEHTPHTEASRPVRWLNTAGKYVVEKPLKGTAWGITEGAKWTWKQKGNIAACAFFTALGGPLGTAVWAGMKAVKSDIEKGQSSASAGHH